MTEPSETNEKAQEPNLPKHLNPPLTKPLRTLLVDVTANEHDTEMDVLLPYFIDKEKKPKKKKKNTEEEEDAQENKAPQ